MDIDLALTADAATIDSSGKLNLLGVFDHLSVGHLPTQHDHIALVMRLFGSATDAGQYQITITLSAPSGKEMLNLNGQINVAPGPRSVETGMRVPHIINLNGVVFEEAGTHTFAISIDGRHQTTLPLTVVPRGPAQTMT